MWLATLERLECGYIREVGLIIQVNNVAGYIREALLITLHSRSLLHFWTQMAPYITFFHLLHTSQCWTLATRATRFSGSLRMIWSNSANCYCCCYIRQTNRTELATCIYIAAFLKFVCYDHDVCVHVCVLCVCMHACVHVCVCVCLFLCNGSSSEKLLSLVWDHCG